VCPKRNPRTTKTPLAGDVESHCHSYVLS
jgi:hypothetical protein